MSLNALTEGGSGEIFCGVRTCCVAWKEVAKSLFFKKKRTLPVLVPFWVACSPIKFRPIKNKCIFSLFFSHATLWHCQTESRAISCNCVTYIFCKDLSSPFPSSLLSYSIIFHRLLGTHSLSGKPTFGLARSATFYHSRRITIRVGRHAYVRTHVTQRRRYSLISLPAERSWGRESCKLGSFTEKVTKLRQRSERKLIFPVTPRQSDRQTDRQACGIRETKSAWRKETDYSPLSRVDRHPSTEIILRLSLKR